MSITCGRRALTAAGLVLAVALVGGCGGGEELRGTTTTAAGPAATAAPTVLPSTEPAERSVTIEVRNGVVVGGPTRVESRLGEQIRFIVSSDVADEVHLHGYDRSARVAAGGQAAIIVKADIPGVFEIELEKRRLRLGELLVKG